MPAATVCTLLLTENVLPFVSWAKIALLPCESQTTLVSNDTSRARSYRMLGQIILADLDLAYRRHTETQLNNSSRTMLETQDVLASDSRRNTSLGMCATIVLLLAGFAPLAPGILNLRII